MLKWCLDIWSTRHFGNKPFGTRVAHLVVLGASLADHNTRILLVPLIVQSELAQQ
jgi:hypothetical protein